ncbi:WD40 repeat-like protein [Athelia psychrophila]|uniref:DDB1- and CUL4-associated factor 13 n=1 Tax=Athelia psychrophila TaxID=1759441 RepID=A0A166JWG2_9AGAM|nr:WD40 repeat-like protein [Fibularhizoctonia sp. CBS 109695]
MPPHPKLYIPLSEKKDTGISALALLPRSHLQQIMVKISVLQHATSSHLPLRPGDPTPTSRNLDPLMHPFARPRERTRALNAAKLDRIFAKPFVDSLEGHVDAVEVMCKKPDSLSLVASGSWDGGLIVHDLGRRKKVSSVPRSHKGKVSGLCFTGSGQEGRLLTCGVDRTVKLWDMNEANDVEAGPSTGRKPLKIFEGKSAFNSIDHHRTEPLFATASNLVQIWDETKSAPVSNLTFPTSVETITSVRFNLSESSILASTGSDRTFTLYDIRTGKAERRVVMNMRANALAWCPTFPTSLLLASEDHNLYTFDIRSLASPTQIYKGHVAAVMSCDWSGTGTEFVSGGWDRTVRIWNKDVGSRPEVYHTKRMQRVSSTLFTADARFVLSGSDDGNLRIWKARAAEKLGIVTARERAAMEYRESLKKRWAVDATVGKVLRKRHLPKPVHQASNLKRTMLDARRVKEERRRAHTRSGENKPKAERKKVVVVEQT